jgi:YHS domain-containing protein
MFKLVNIGALSIVSLLSLSACDRKPPAKPAAATVAGATKPYAVGDKAHCPVTGEEFTVSASTVQVEHEGKHYAFCCADCQPGFMKDPAKYTKKN